MKTYLFGSENCFGIEIYELTNAYEMHLLIHGKDILEFKINDIDYTYVWKNLDEIVEWFDENIQYIMQTDIFPFKTNGESAAEMCKNCYEKSFDDLNDYEKLQDWIFKHSWFYARNGSFLADVYFRKVSDVIEISWDNTKTFKNDGVCFLLKTGTYQIDAKIFKQAIEDLIVWYNTRYIC